MISSKIKRNLNFLLRESSDFVMHGEKLLAFKYMNAHYVHIVKFSLERARDQRMLKKPTKKKC
jgi:hypothetical protein